MSHQVSKSQFKARALQFFRQVEISGEPLVVTDHGEPKIEVRPYRPSSHKALDGLRGSVLRYDNPTDPVGVDDWDATR